MNDQERFESMEKLKGILESVTLLRASLNIHGPDQHGQDALVQAWDVALDLQRQLCTQTVIEGFRDDALEQAARVWDLIVECGLAPDDTQLANIGYACELTAVKIKKYQRLVNYAAQVDVLIGPATTEGV